MAIINQSENLYGVSFVDASFSVELELSGATDPEIYNPYADAGFDGTLELGGELGGAAYEKGDDSFRIKVGLSGGWDCVTELVLTEPAPITPTVSADAFSNQRYAGGGGRLYINNVVVPFVSAEINAPGKSLGKTLAIELARAELSLLPVNAVFKFQIGRIVAGLPVWTTIIDGAKLVSRNYRMSSGRDGLSFSVKSPDSKLDKSPKNNLIVYDPAKGQVSVEEFELLPTNTDEIITTSARSVSVLTLYKLLKIAFVEGCGFSSVETDIPNYEIARCDFIVTNSYGSSVAQFIGMYEPIFSVSSNVLKIQRTINPLPEDFTPNPLPGSRYPNFSESLQNIDSNLDGYIIQYMGGAGAYSIDRSLPALVEASTFHDVETTTRRTMRDWFEADAPGIVVRSELKKETIETRRGGTLVGRETQNNTFDRLGRSAGYTKISEVRMPDCELPLNAGGAVPMALLTTREEEQKIHYGANPFNPRQTMQSKVETIVRSLLALDSENTALDRNGEDAPYAQDYQKVFEAGNLKTTMDKLFSEMQNTVEHFRPLRNGQIQVRYEGYDFLRNAPRPPVTDIRSGDISVANFSKQKNKTIFRSGVNQATRAGELKVLNAGELPLYFAEPLADWLLENPRISGNVEVTGYDESIERGVNFNLRGRAGEDLGNFLIEGYKILITPNSIKTNLDALKV